MTQCRLPPPDLAARHADGSAHTGATASAFQSQQLQSRRALVARPNLLDLSRVIAQPRGSRRIRMSPLYRHTLSRRGFCTCCAAAAFAATGGWRGPAQAYAEARNIVDLIRDEAAKAI